MQILDPEQATTFLQRFSPRPDDADPASAAAVAHTRALRDLVALASAPEPLDALRRAAALVAAVLPGADVVVYARDDGGVRLVGGTWALRRGGAPRAGDDERALAARAAAGNAPVLAPPSELGGGAAGTALPARWRGGTVGAVVAIGPPLAAGELRVVLAFADAAGVLLGRARDDGMAAADRRRAHALEATAARALEAAASREPLARAGELAAGVAHEMATPLSCLASNLRDVAATLATLAAGGEASHAELLGAAHDAVADTNRLAEIVRAFRDLARPGLGARVRYDPAGPIEDALRLFRSARRGCDVDASIACPLPAVEGVPSGLAHVLLNLLENGADAMGGRGVLGVEARGVGDALVLRVSDRGPGIAPSVRDRVFEPWVTHGKPGRGTGLGLAICRDVVEAHGGSIEFTTGEEGTTFEVRLPAV